MAEFKDELLKSVAGRGKGDIADAIGMPDQADYENLARIIAIYKKKRFPVVVAGKTVHVTGAVMIQHSLAQARHQYYLGIHGKNKHSLVNKDSGTRYALELPADLYYAIEAMFPSMFRSKKHLRWFCKKFPGLTIAGEAL